MSFAYLPLYTGDYLRDTRHLSPLKHGIFLLLLMHCWDQKGPLPLDDNELAGIANCRSHDEIEALKYVVNRFFTAMQDGHYNKRMQTEIERSENISRIRSDAGKKGYEAKAKHLLSKSQALASNPIPIPIPSPAPSPKNERQTTRQRATRLSPDWRLPEEWKAWAIEAHHLDPQQVVRISLVFRDHWLGVPGSKGTKLDWQATWRNWVRREVEHV